MTPPSAIPREGRSLPLTNNVSSSPIVSIARPARRGRQILSEAIASLLHPLAFTPKRKAFIKPNLCAPVPGGGGIVTSLALVRALIEQLRRMGTEEILIGEDAEPGCRTEECFDAAGYKSLAAETGVELLDLGGAERREVSWEFGSLSLPALLFDEETSYINVPVMKTHFNTIATLGLKNQKGLLLGETKKLFHVQYELHRPIAALAACIAPDLTLVDGMVGLEGDGPGRLGRAKRVGLLVAGLDPVAVDATCCRIMGIGPDEVEHIRLASLMGVGRLEAQVVGEDLASSVSPFRRATPDRLKRLGLVIHCAEDGCSACNKAVIEAMRSMARSPRLWPALLMHGVIRRQDFIVGAKCSIPRDAVRPVCVGVCAREVAARHGFPLVMGCPPLPEEILQVLLSKGAAAAKVSQ